jgi:hypothetical protein
MIVSDFTWTKDGDIQYAFDNCDQTGAPNKRARLLRNLVHLLPKLNVDEFPDVALGQL